MDWNDLFPAGEPVIALPDWECPRLLLSARAPELRWRDSAFYPAHRASAKAYKLIRRVRAITRVGQIRYSTGGQWNPGKFLEGIVSDPQPPVVQIGTACAAQKWTLRIFDGSGKIAAYVKWGSSSFARHRLENEFKILSSIPKGFGPRPLKYGPLADGYALCIEPLAGKPLNSTGARWRGHLADFLETLSLRTPVEVSSHPAFARLAADAPAPIHHWIEQLAGRAWPIVIQHGDLAPWNIFRNGDPAAPSRLTALDWEFGSLEGAPYFDAAYYALQVAGLMKRRDPESAMQHAIGELTRNPWPALDYASAQAIAALAAFDAWRTALVDGDSPSEPLQQWQRAIWERKPAHRPAAVRAGRFMRPAPVRAAAVLLEPSV